MYKTIKFKAMNEYDYDVFLKPYPASSNIPDWWKSMTPYSITPDNPTGGKPLISPVINSTFKKCTPMLDAMTSGYLVPLWADVQVRITDNGPAVFWKTDRQIFEAHGSDSSLVPSPPGYLNNVFKYLNTWIPITPKGYSVLITSPFGYRGLPFHAIPAIVDADKSTLDLVPPMWIKDGFEGIIEKGTPMFQITPFKRENWLSEFETYKGDEFLRSKDKGFNSTIVNHYIKNAWSKKSYK